MSIPRVVSIVEIIQVIIGVLALWSALDNSTRALADGGNLKKSGLNGSRRRTAYWAARNEVLIAAASVIYIARVIVNMTLPEPEGDSVLAANVITGLGFALGLLYLIVSTWNRYDRRRLRADYKREEAATAHALLEALETVPPPHQATVPVPVPVPPDPGASTGASVAKLLEGGEITLGGELTIEASDKAQVKLGTKRKEQDNG